MTTVLSVTCQFEKIWGREIAADLKAPCLRYLLNTIELSRLYVQYEDEEILMLIGTYLLHTFCR